MNYQKWSQVTFWLVIIAVFLLGYLVPKAPVVKEVVKEVQVVVTTTPIPTPIPTSVPKVIINRLPEAFRKAYLNSCNSEGDKGDYCECTLTELEKQYTNEEIIAIANKYDKDNKIPQVLLDAASKCVYTL